MIAAKSRGKGKSKTLGIKNNTNNKQQNNNGSADHKDLYS